MKQSNRAQKYKAFIKNRLFGACILGWAENFLGKILREVFAIKKQPSIFALQFNNGPFV